MIATGLTYVSQRRQSNAAIQILRDRRRDSESQAVGPVRGSSASHSGHEVPVLLGVTCIL